MENSSFKKSDLIPAAVWMILGILVVIGSYNLGFGNLRNPGPGLMPFLLGVLLIFVTLPIFIYSLGKIERGEEEAGIWAGVSFWRMGTIVVTLLVYGSIFEKVGFLVTAFCCLFFLFKVAGSGKVGKVLVLTSVTVISAYLLFVIALKVYMPSFPWKGLMNIVLKCFQ